MKDLLKIQGQNGNWNYDNYMLGMYNGMELMLATHENREPIYRTCKEEDFLCHKVVTGNPVEQTVKVGE